MMAREHAVLRRPRLKRRGSHPPAVPARGGAVGGGVPPAVLVGRGDGGGGSGGGGAAADRRADRPAAGGMAWPAGRRPEQRLRLGRAFVSDSRAFVSDSPLPNFGLVPICAYGKSVLTRGALRCPT